jgi:UDP-2,4-diacetamido-2,4,6-trideoxy-beta-L-altropyranose hydrolase
MLTPREAPMITGASDWAQRGAVFRADAGPMLGTGHVMRCLALAAAFSSNGWLIGFVATAETFATVPSLDSGATDRIIVSGVADEEPQALAARWRSGVDLLVVDHYGRDSTFETACRGWARRILVIDDLADRPHDADILVDSGRSSASSYRAFVPTSCRVLVGSEYALIRPEFTAARASALARRGGAMVTRVLVNFGFTDAVNATRIALSALASAGFAGAIDLVLPDARGIPDVVPANTTIHVDVMDLSNLMAQADLAVGAGGASAWERCCLGLPSIIMVLAENQRGIAEMIAAAEAGINVGLAGNVTVARVADAFRALRDDGERRTRMTAAGARLVDGEGAMRVAGLVT